jgi:hypothetical protein
VWGCGRSGFDVERRTDGAIDVPSDIAVDAAPLRGVYISNGGVNAATSSVAFFAPDASATANPTRVLTGPSSGLDGPLGLFADVTHGELYVANFFPPYSIRVYPLGAEGDVAPTRTLDAGTVSRLFEPRHAWIDLAHDEMIVADFDGALRSYPRTASGEVAPLREISGAATLIDNPLELALDPVNDEIYVTTDNVDGMSHSAVLVFDRTATGNVAPKRIVDGSNASFNQNAAEWLALDLVNRELLVGTHNATAISVFDMTASGNAVPKRELLGTATLLNNVATMFVDNTSDRIDVVLQQPTNQLLVFPRTASGNVAPLLHLVSPSFADIWGFAVDGTTGFTGP